MWRNEHTKKCGIFEEREKNTFLTYIYKEHVRNTRGTWNEKWGTIEVQYRWVWSSPDLPLFVSCSSHVRNLFFSCSAKVRHFLVCSFLRTALLRGYTTPKIRPLVRSCRAVSIILAKIIISDCGLSPSFSQNSLNKKLICWCIFIHFLYVSSRRFAGQWASFWSK